MLRGLYILFFFISFSINGQYAIKGEIEPSSNFSWILLYKMENGEKTFIENTNVTNGRFEFNLTNGNSGIYRAYYQIENNSYIEFIFNNESLNFKFNPNNPESIVFSNSKENQIYQDYQNEISSKQRVVDSLQISFFNYRDVAEDELIEKAYQQGLVDLNTTQLKFEKDSENTIAQHFIKSSKQYNNSAPIKDPQEYLLSVKVHFFDYLDIKDPQLRNSTFINDKLIDYVLYLNQNEDLKLRNQLQKKAIKRISFLIPLDFLLLKNFEEGLLRQYVYEENIEMVNHVLDEYYNYLPKEYQNNELKLEIDSAMKTAIGAKAPNVVWQENGVSKNLHDLNDTEYYIVVFFSSTCGHCQKEMPDFHSFISTIQNVSVIAIGLEDEKESWEKMTSDFRNFTNIIELDSWESDNAKNYGILEIPNYFILDSDKKILAKPVDFDELKSLFQQTKQ